MRYSNKYLKCRHAGGFLEVRVEGDRRVDGPPSL